MGYYLNSTRPYDAFLSASRQPYFVDKTDILESLVCRSAQASLLPNGPGVLYSRYLAVHWSSGFGKTTTARLIAAYFGKAADGHALFDPLHVSRQPWYRSCLNQYNVVFLPCLEQPEGEHNFRRYWDRIEHLLLHDLMEAYPYAGITEEFSLWDAFTFVFLRYQETFVFVLDDWDFILHQPTITVAEKEQYLHDLGCLLKDKAYVELAYLSGRHPIPNYSSASPLDMFYEYSLEKVPFSTSFGFTDAEVDQLYRRYRERTFHPAVSREDLRQAFGTHRNPQGVILYHPQSVVSALENNRIP